jgi:16S rRNA processing protein RimM
MLLLGYLAKMQGLKGEFILHDFMEDPARITKIPGLMLVPPNINLENADSIANLTKTVTIRSFRLHKNRVCIAFNGIDDRTSAEPYQRWALWTTNSDLPALPEGESYRHEWYGCEVFVDGLKIGEVMRLDPTPIGYDMIVIQDIREGRSGKLLDVPYIKVWFTIDLVGRRIDLDPPLGLIDLD